MKKERLQRQLEFIVEIDKLKQVYRQNFLVDGSRKENDTEHSWHLAVMAFLLAEYAPRQDLDVLRVIKMALIHDLIEIDAGDTYCYDEEAARDKPEREQKAADRLFGRLPQDQSREFMELWQEFEECATPEARFAAVLDRLQPLLLNYGSRGKSWQIHGITSKQVYKRNQLVKETSDILWNYVDETIKDAVRKGYLKE